MTRKPSKRKTQRPIERFVFENGKLRAIKHPSLPSKQIKLEKALRLGKIISRIRKTTPEKRGPLIRELLRAIALNGSIQSARYAKRKLTALGEKTAGLDWLLEHLYDLNSVRTKNEKIAQRKVSSVHDAFAIERDPLKRELLKTILNRCEKAFRKRFGKEV